MYNNNLDTSNAMVNNSADLNVKISCSAKADFQQLEEQTQIYWNYEYKQPN